MNSLRVFLPIKMPFIELKNNIYLSFITRDLNCSKTFWGRGGKRKNTAYQVKENLTVISYWNTFLKYWGSMLCEPVWSGPMNVSRHTQLSGVHRSLWLEELGVWLPASRCQQISKWQSLVFLEKMVALKGGVYGIMSYWGPSPDSTPQNFQGYSDFSRGHLVVASWQQRHIVTLAAMF